MTDADAQRLVVCRSLVSERRLIGQLIGFDLCPCPAWDILLDLYLAHHEQRRPYLWSLCVAANIPLSSAHRRISELIREGLLQRCSDPADGRRVTISFSPATLQTLETLLDRLRPGSPSQQR